MINHQTNDLISITHFARVKGQSGEKLVVNDVNSDLEFSIIGNALIKDCANADQFLEEQKITRTEMAKILTESFNRPLTVEFIKADGSKRKLRGIMVMPEPLLGRSHCEDLDLPKEKHRLRLVDHRTLQSLTVNGIKYVLKKGTK